MEQIYGRVLAQHIRMRMKDLTSRQLFSVPCTRCGAATGHLCGLHSGGLRFEPHLDRKLSAIEAVERKRMHVDVKPLNSKIAKLIYIEKMPHLGKHPNRAIAKAEGRDD
jgi:hypothetical protein